MTTQKLTGSYYTPYELVDFMITHISSFGIFDRILEPSVGDGRFIDKLLRNFSSKIDVLDISDKKIKNLKKTYSDRTDVSCKSGNFITYSLNSSKKYDLIIGNPPYIRKRNMDEVSMNETVKLVEKHGLSKSMIQNIWVSFVLGSIDLLTENGSVFFVLPFEFLQVNYAKALRDFLEQKFDLIEIISFNEHVFKDIEQEVCLVHLRKKAEKTQIVYYVYDEIRSGKLLQTNKILRNKPLDKWSNSILSDEEIDLLAEYRKQYIKIDLCGDISPGIVTGANSFFIVDSNTAAKLHDVSKEIILSKSKDIESCLIFNNRRLKSTLSNNKKAYLLNFGYTNEPELSNSARNYLQLGVEDEINQRFKCSNRKPWYRVPLTAKGDLFFFKRYHLIPKICVNNANVFTTDMCYNLRLNKYFDKNSFSFCFYNSLTLALCEYNGRFYGGGVSELTPSEFKSLPIPYMKVDYSKVRKLDKMFRNKEELDVILDYVDSIVFSDSSVNISKLRSIRKKFISRRIK